MSGSSRVDLATAATLSVITVDQLKKAIREHHAGPEGHPKKHLAYAAVGATAAVGALKMLRRDELRSRENDLPTTNTTDADAGFVHLHRHHHDSETMQTSPGPRFQHETDDHKRRPAEEIGGAYALGQKIMGHQKHHVTHVVAEVLGAVAALENTRDMLMR